MIVLGIETSCDETAVALVKDGKEIISNVVYSQIPIHQEFGGVVPEIASRNHVGKITIVLEEAFRLANIKPASVNLIAVTGHPGLIGSLLVGINAAKSLSLAYRIPYLLVNHIHGHIYANYLIDDFSFPLIALIVSGGHTELVLMEEHFSFKLLGQTLDDAVGEAYDKVGRVLGLSYPGGPEVDKLAQIGKINYDLPHIYLNKDEYNFSFSGLKTAVLNLVNTKKMRGEEVVIADVAASFQNSAISVLVDKTIRAAEEYQVKQIIVAGGVAANSGLRRMFNTRIARLNNIRLTFPPISLCTDNAAMIASAGYHQYLNKEK